MTNTTIPARIIEMAQADAERDRPAILAEIERSWAKDAAPRINAGVRGSIIRGYAYEASYARFRAKDLGSYPEAPQYRTVYLATVTE